MIWIPCSLNTSRVSRFNAEYVAAIALRILAVHIELVDDTEVAEGRCQHEKFSASDTGLFPLSPGARDLMPGHPRQQINKSQQARRIAVPVSKQENGVPDGGSSWKENPNGEGRLN